MTPSSTYFLGLAAAVYVTTCLVVAAVRWFHMCQPYDRNPRYYYPGRPFVTGVWLSSLFLLPYIFNPASVDAWYVTRLYFLPATLFHFTLLLISYFGVVMGWKHWKRAVLLAGIPVSLAMVAAVVLAVIPGDQTMASAFTIALYILGVLVTGLCIGSVVMVYRCAGLFDPDDFSNPKDFPVSQARRWLVMITPTLVLCWTGVLLNDPAVLAVIMIAIAVLCVVFVISVLHPNRNRPLEEPSEKEEEATQVYHRSLPKKKQTEILSAIRTVVEEQQAFLDPHLILQDVASRCGYNRTYIAGLVKSELGGFATYVNRLRLMYVEDYQRQNPDATLGEAIDAAGFGSRSGYYDAKSKSLQNS